MSGSCILPLFTSSIHCIACPIIAYPPHSFDNHAPSTRYLLGLSQLFDPCHVLARSPASPDIDPFDAVAKLQILAQVSLGASTTCIRQGLSPALERSIQLYTYALPKA